MALATLVIPMQLFGRTMWLSTSLKLLTIPVTALPKFSEIVRLLTLRVANTAAGPTLNIGRSSALTVNIYIIVCTTPMKTEVPGIRDPLSMWCIIPASVPLTSVVMTSMMVSRTSPSQPPVS